MTTEKESKMSDTKHDAHTAATAKIAAHVGSPAAVGFLMAFFLNYILPILPSLLLAAAPQLTSAKSQTVLKAVDTVLDQLINEP